MRVYARKRAAREGLMSKERIFLMVLILEMFEYITSYDVQGGVEALRLLWRAIPEAFFTQDEFASFFEHQIEQEILQYLHRFYSEIIEEYSFIKKPRSLGHYCRTIIRKGLYECRQLPDGIEQLELDGNSKAFLRLER